MGEGSSNSSKQRANIVQDGEFQSIMEARFRLWITNKNAIATFYLTVLTFFS